MFEARTPFACKGVMSELPCLNDYDYMSLVKVIAPKIGS